MHPWAPIVGNDAVVHIIVVGAGEVGSHVADRLSREGHDVVIVEANDVRRRQLEEQLDVLVLGGSGTHPSTLREAGLADFRGGQVTIHDRPGLESLAEFDPLYLYLDRPAN